MQQVVTVEQVQQERTRLEKAISTLATRAGAAAELAVVLKSEFADLEDIKSAFAEYYSAEASALQHDIAAIGDQLSHLSQLEQHVRLQASGLVVAAHAPRR